ncbi:hypothetical protein BKA81DRAFT_362655 [Phyllosticta paracitricarpa]
MLHPFTWTQVIVCLCLLLAGLLGVLPASSAAPCCEHEPPVSTLPHRAVWHCTFLVLSCPAKSSCSRHCYPRTATDSMARTSTQARTDGRAR